MSANTPVQKGSTEELQQRITTLEKQVVSLTAVLQRYVAQVAELQLALEMQKQN